MSTYPIESLLSARLFLNPQVVGDQLYFISNMSGRLSLYVMDVAGSVPLPLLPPDIALPNPDHLDEAVAFKVLPKLGKILLMLDRDGDENYQPMWLPLEGGAPQPIFGDRFAGQQVFCAECDPERLLALFSVDPRTNPVYRTFRVDLHALAMEDLGGSEHHNTPLGFSEDMNTVLLADIYTFGDTVLYHWQSGAGPRRLLYGTPLEQRQPGGHYPRNGIGVALPTERGLLLTTCLFDDHYGLGYLPLATPGEVQPVAVEGVAHGGLGELTSLYHRGGNRYTVHYNIDGSSWVYEGEFDEAGLRFVAQRVLAGEGQLGNGVLQALDYEAASGRYALSFSTATSPAQLYLLEPDGALRQLTHERLLGIPPAVMAPGEDYAYISHDGLRISARLYLPAAELGFQGPRPVIFYIHGGPQSQERPDFTWFSMPLIQFFTLNGFAVWVPNARGSSGYGMDYMQRVDHDWGGLDRLDHVAAFELLRADSRLDMSRAGVMGRSYGGYMTLTLLGRHPELWRAGVDLFGPYNLFTFIERLPETWKTYFYQALGHPQRDYDFLQERSPSTHLPNLACPLLVMQGANDPRVVERESRDVVETLQARGKHVEYEVFADEGHDVIKYDNRVYGYNRIAHFFAEYLRP